MAIEFETQILDINPEDIAQKLRALGATEKEEVFQKRWVFDIECLNAQSPGTGEWVRLRQAGDVATVTYKNKRGTGLADTTEIETRVADFDKMADILGGLGCFGGKYYQENKRRQFVLGDLEFDIDQWPKIPPFLEIEGKSEQAVKEGMKMLGLENKENGHFGLLNIYSKYGINLHDFKEIKF